MRIALATCRRLPEPDADEKPLLAALGRLGADARLLAWDDPKADPGAFDLCVIRSTWDYVHRLPDFLRWARETARRTRLLNPWPVVRWNSDKRYLAALARRGLRVVPTLYVKQGGAEGLARRLRRRGWDEVVAKPRVGAGSFLTRRFPRARFEEAEAFVASARRDMMVQPYVRSVETRGERSLVWLGGRLTHAVRKSPRLAGDAESVTRCPRIEADERAFAAAALRPYAARLLYARVDVARDDEGRLALMELELIEPSLFLTHDEKALALFARLCAAAALRRRAPARALG